MNLPGRRSNHRDRTLLRGLGRLRRQLDIPSGALSSSLVVTGLRLKVWGRPWWNWWKGSTIARSMMMMARGRARRMGVWRLRDTAGLGTSPWAGTTRGTWPGPLTLSPVAAVAVTTWRLVSWRILTLFLTMSSLAFRRPRPAVVRPVGAGPSHHWDAGSHGLGLRGPCGCFRPLRLGRFFGLGTLGTSLQSGFRRVDLHGIVHGLTCFLRCLRRGGGLPTILLSRSLGLCSPGFWQPVFTNETGSVLSAKWLAIIQMALLTATMVIIPTMEMGTLRKLWLRFGWRRPVTWSFRHFPRRHGLTKT